jgi:hypothetical protein
MIAWFRVFGSRVRGLFAYGRSGSNFDDELQTHMFLLTERSSSEG